MATPPHVFFSSSRPQTPHGQCFRSCLRQRRLLQPHIKGHSRFVSPLFQNEAECDVRLIVKFWNVENVFSRVWESTRWLHFGIWVLHHSMLLHAVICVIVYKVYVLGQGHSTAYLFALVLFESIFLLRLFVRFRFLRYNLLIFFSSYLFLLIYYLDGIFLFHNSRLIFSPLSFQCTVL